MYFFLYIVTVINLLQIEKIAREQFCLHRASIHGLGHWKQVAENGIVLSTQPGTDGIVVQLFALLHDCKRMDEYTDTEHGQRAAEFAVRIRSQHLKALSDEQFEKLHWACAYHNHGQVHDDPTIGACFDADRLELTRVGILPRADLMCTSIGKRMAVKMKHSFILSSD
jgi:uncharacterized protein